MPVGRPTGAEGAHSSDPVDGIIERDIDRIRKANGVYTRGELAALMHCGVAYVRALERLAGVSLRP